MARVEATARRGRGQQPEPASCTSTGCQAARACCLQAMLAVRFSSKQARKESVHRRSAVTCLRVEHEVLVQEYSVVGSDAKVMHEL